jgi:hypothetical protein
MAGCLRSDDPAADAAGLFVLASKKPAHAALANWAEF